ncbi:MAG TPA: alpha/beta fold hydrolase, partial [Verrucomicrobiae bacterium]|nr:alpha/beta fold hydrolase [Verrucomicrobiae bacterium]
MESQKIYFYSEGMKIEGLLFGHSDDIPKPAIMICQGFGGLKETTAAPTAEFLAEKGYVTLCIDYRYFGASEGEPRGRLIPMCQIEDIRNAITFLQQQPGVDPEKIGLYGSSYGGSNVIYTAAIDKRVKCIVATVPVANSYEWQRQMRRNFEWVQFLEEVAENR